MTIIKNTAATIALAAAPVAAFAAAIAAPAAPLSAAEKTSATISYDDLNLSSSAGRDVLDRRIERGVEQVCGRTTGTPATDVDVRKCQRETLAAARQSRDLAIADYAGERLARSNERVIRLVAQ